MQIITKFIQSNYLNFHKHNYFFEIFENYFIYFINNEH